MPVPSAETPPPPPGPEILEALARRAEPDGFVPFDRYMDVALYGPGVGYYARPRSPFGPRGDFYTAPSVHPVFARTLARRVQEVERAVGGPGPFSVVDLGCGDGTLLCGLARALEPERKGEGPRYVAVDRAEARRSAALAEVRRCGAGIGDRARAVATLAEIGPVEGVVLAHELLDALPARRWRWDGLAWHELGVRIDHGALREVEASAGRGHATPSAGLPTLTPEQAGTVAETSAAAEALVREVADHLVSGLLVVVDFGAEEGELLAGHPRGTLAAVRSHRTVASLLEAAGETDLSSFVNFSRVRAAAGRAGLVEVAYRSQAEALGAWGFGDELDRALRACASAEEEVRTRLAAKNLLFGFGAFRVLELAAPGRAPRRRGPSDPSRAAPP